VDTNKHLVILLFGLLLCFVPQPLLWESNIKPVSPAHQKKLCFTEGQLVFSETNECLESAENQTPVVYAPLFFRKISINRADYDLLLTVPGIGHKTAVDILAFRKSNGLLTHLEELENIRGIGRKKLKKLRIHITL